MNTATAMAQASEISRTLQPDTLTLFYVFVAPGLVALMVYDLLVPTQRRDFGANVVQALAFGGVNVALWAWVAFVDLQDLARNHPLRFYLLAVFSLLISPSILAYALYRLRNAGFVQGRLPSTAPTGWDAFFGSGESCLVLVHLKTGEKIGGLYADGSDASTFPNVQQIYLEELWKLDGEFNLIEPIPRTRGGIVDKADCDYIEFFTLEEQPEQDPHEGSTRDPRRTTSSDHAGGDDG